KTEDGWVTPFFTVMLVAFLAMAGFAVDVANVMSQRTLLQATADSSAHGAILYRKVEPEANAKARAIGIAELNMPPSAFGNVVREQDIVFGQWNASTNTFTPSANSRDTVIVTAQRRRETDNSVPLYLLQVVGLDAWNISAVAIFTANKHPCFFNGVLANEVVAFQSNGVFHRDFCIHANDYVSLRQNNTFMPGSIVSMPDPNRLSIPSSGMDGNTGLAEALRAGSIDLGVVRNLSNVIEGLRVGNASILPDYITGMATVQVNLNQVNNSTFQRGRVYDVRCNGNNSTLTLTSGMNLTEVVLTTNCNIQLGNGATIRDSMIATTSTSATSISGTAGSGAQATVGRACAPGPGTQVLTLGGMRFPAKLIVNGGQFMAAGSINFASQGTIEGSGVSVIAGKNVDWSSNADMSVQYCDQEFDNHLSETLIRMVN
ncbi:MAG: TadE/TadG family type IV pilus assembly protein, partial [Paracoccaceae bacterium]